MNNERKPRKVEIKLIFERGDVVKHKIGGNKGMVVGWRTHHTGGIDYLVELSAVERDWYSEEVLEFADGGLMAKIGLRRN